MVYNSRPKVLIIEDSKSLATTLIKLLKDNHGFDSVWTETYREAKQRLEDRRDEFFVAIVDLELPDASNGEAVDLVISHQVPTLIFTGNYSIGSQEGFWSKGIADYVHKNSAYSFQYINWSHSLLFL